MKLIRRPALERHLSVFGMQDPDRRVRGAMMTSLIKTAVVIDGVYAANVEGVSNRKANDARYREKNRCIGCCVLISSQ